MVGKRRWSGRGDGSFESSDKVSVLKYFVMGNVVI